MSNVNWRGIVVTRSDRDLQFLGSILRIFAYFLAGNELQFKRKLFAMVCTMLGVMYLSQPQTTF